MTSIGSVTPTGDGTGVRGIDAPDGVRLVVPTMGTMASIRVDGPRGDTRGLEGRITAVVDRLDREFSRWDPRSPASDVAHGRLRLGDTSAEHRAVYALAIDWRNRSGGAFDPHRPDGTVDLAGIVKALAIERVGAVLDDLDAVGWVCNIGGDVLVAGTTMTGRPWTAGIVDPADRSSLIRRVRLLARHRAVATSGTAERGAHIWSPLGDQSTSERFVQASVVAADIVTADVLATAVMAGGATAAALAASEHGCVVLAVRPDGTTATWGLDRQLQTRRGAHAA
ncbi:FAD:protein FMN transferase [Curtobacterium sp. MCBD17_013]|uniref:FAD:protein FMN transferase n=1 Tax=Curtobacterium sp. MCBD17_013 TaxID=2175668 RepID=UPI000DA9B404|nr:FAD:protein FMN transferase [Curtobacterium sp. MCBD17_013]PZF64481.1 FAD:protein FMN transferase [Curtobacterium sp. MCBD17_013]